MKIKFQSPILIFGLLSFLFLSNCIRKEEFDGYGNPDEYDASAYTPLIKSSLTLRGAINNHVTIGKDGLLDSLSDGSYFFSYRDSVVSQTADSLISFDPVSVSQKVSIPGFPISSPLPPDTSITYSYDLKFDNVNFATDVTLLYLLLKDGALGMDVNTTFNQNLSYKITLNSIVNTKQNNTPLEILGSINYPLTSNSSNINLKDYKIVMSEAGVPTTSVKAKVELTITSSNQFTSTTPQDVNFTFSISNLKFKRLVGQIRNLDFPAKSQETQINAFNNDFINKIKFADPSVKFSFENSLGVPISVNLGEIEAINGTNSIKLTYNNSDSLPNFDLGYPDTTKFGQSVSSSVTINKANCPNLIDFLYSSPDRLKYSISGNIGSATGYHFIEDVSKVKVKYELKVPIYGSITDMSISKLIGYKFPDDNLQLDSLVFKTKIANRVPINVKVQVYFTTGDTTQILDSLYYPNSITDKMNIFEAAQDKDGDGIAESPSLPKTTFIKRDKEWYDRVKYLTRFILVKGTFYTPEGQNVKFLGSQGVDVEISWFGKGKYIIK